MILAIGLDADDTLWHNETHFRLSQARFEDLLRDHCAAEHLRGRLLETERRNLGRYGFGVKGFMLSMIETAIEVSDGRVPGTVIAEIMASGRAMLEQPVELLPHAREVVARLSATHHLILITKGDLIDQERKVAQSGLGEFFAGVEIVSDKTPASYLSILSRHGIPADRSVMVGNSLKSDVLPMIAVGGYGIHVPHGLTWALESADPPEGHPRFARIGHLGELPDLVDRL
jgi:putative hydrolase of the HAD superfamily